MEPDIKSYMERTQAALAACAAYPWDLDCRIMGG